MGRATLLRPVFIHFPTKEKIGSEYPGKNLTAGDEGISQQLRVLAALAEVLGSVSKS